MPLCYVVVTIIIIIILDDDLAMQIYVEMRDIYVLYRYHYRNSIFDNNIHNNISIWLLQGLLL